MNRNRQLLLALLLFFFVVVGFILWDVTRHDQYKQFDFAGESTHWTGQMHVSRHEVKNQPSKPDEELKLTVIYKGDLSELSRVAHLTYTYESLDGGGSSSLNFGSPPDSTARFILCNLEAEVLQ